MARWCILVILALAVVASARDMPIDNAGLEDQKNFLGYGFSGVGSNGLPFGGIGSGYDGNMGGPSGLGGLGGFGGPGGPVGGLGGLGGFGGPGGNGEGPNIPLP